MSKFEKVLLICLFIASCIFSFKKPDDIVERKDQDVVIVIEVEGYIEKQLEFDHNPTIEEIFTKLNIDNIYGFENDYVLGHQENLYIPKNNNLISLNHATLQQLTTINGIGEKTALKIIEYRNEQPFQTIEDIQNVKGIGEKTYLKLREYLCL